MKIRSLLKTSFPALSFALTDRTSRLGVGQPSGRPWPVLFRSSTRTVALGRSSRLSRQKTPWASTCMSTAFFAMTGLHASHVVSGVAMLALVYYLGARGHFSARDHWGVEAVVKYWHFVDVVWVFFYPALYLIGA